VRRFYGAGGIAYHDEQCDVYSAEDLAICEPAGHSRKRRLGSINRMLVGLHQRPTSKFDGLQKRYGGLSRDNARGAKTVVLKLKTKEFNSLTRSVTPAVPPSSCDELMTIALALRERVELGSQQLFRLVGVGLSNFQLDVESSLFENGVAASSAELLI